MEVILLLLSTSQSNLLTPFSDILYVIIVKKLLLLKLYLSYTVLLPSGNCVGWISKFISDQFVMRWVTGSLSYQLLRLAQCPVVAKCVLSTSQGAVASFFGWEGNHCASRSGVAWAMHHTLCVWAQSPQQWRL